MKMVSRSKKGRRGEADETGKVSNLSTDELKYAAFLAFWTTCLHLRAWGLPEYDQLSPLDRKYFRNLIAKGRDALFAHVEDCKRAVLRVGLGDRVRDEWLALVYLTDFDLESGLPEARRNVLRRILHEMYPLLVRLDPDAAPPSRIESLPAADGSRIDRLRRLAGEASRQWRDVVEDAVRPAPADGIWREAEENRGDAEHAEGRRKQEESLNEPLTPKTKAVLEMLAALAAGDALTGKEILQKLDADPRGLRTGQSYLTKTIIPALKNPPYNVRNRHGVGYYIAKRSAE